MAQSDTDDKRVPKTPSSIGSLLGKYQLEDKGGYITKEFQDYGYRLAMELQDKDRVSMYMKLAKNENRALLEKARSFVTDAKARNPAALFMWKVKQLREE